MRHRSGESPRRADGDSPPAAGISTPGGPEMRPHEGRSDVAGLGLASLTMPRRTPLLAGVAESGGWRPIESP
jgi:hypothetical protein